MRADRLLSILMLLQIKGRLTAHELSRRLEVSERTIYRDLEALDMAGIPICTTTGPGGGCSLLAGYQTRLTGLTEPEMRALFLSHLAHPLLDLGMAKDHTTAMLKLAAGLPESIRPDMEHIQQRFHLDTTLWHHNTEAQPHLPTLQEAIWQDHILCLTYQTENGLRETLVEPYALISKAFTWYLVGAVNQQLHVFSIPRIQTASIMETHFARPTDFDLPAFWNAWCKAWEQNAPRYAAPLHLAPDESAQLPQALNSWGYMLVEYNELTDMSVWATPAHGKEKNAPTHSLTKPSLRHSTDRLQKKRPRLQKKAKSIASPLLKKTLFVSKKTYILSPSKKKNAIPSQKKDTSPLNTSRQSGPLKKNNFIPTPSKIPSPTPPYHTAA